MLVSWIYAIVQERLRYAPTGWSKKYEFSEADAMNALDVVDAWISRVAGGKAHMAPESVPWEALKEILGISVFGGRVDNVYDQRVLDIFLESIFVKEAYDVDFPLVKGSDGSTLLSLPEGRTRADFMAWVAGLPDTTDLEWLGLSGAAELGRLKVRGGNIMGKIMILGGGGGRKEDESGRGRASSVVEKVEMCSGVVKDWIADLKDNQNELGKGGWASNSGADWDSLQRCIAREILVGVEFLDEVMKDLGEVFIYCMGGKKLTQRVKMLVDSISSGVTPKGWTELFEGGGNIVAEKWVDNFKMRIEQLKSFVEGGGRGLEKMNFWVGGLFHPGSFVTATRQFIARKGNWSIDELDLVLVVGGKRGGEVFNVVGLGMEGGKLSDDGKEIEVSNNVIDKLSTCGFEWVVSGKGKDVGGMSLPVYLSNADREKIVVSVKFLGGGERVDFWLQRGLALSFNA